MTLVEEKTNLLRLRQLILFQNIDTLFLIRAIEEYSIYVSIIFSYNVI